MRKMRRLSGIALIVSGLILVASCGGNGKSSKTVASAAADKYKPFPSIQVPDMLTDPSERISYILEHFWDGLVSPSVSGKCDSTHVVGFSIDDIEKQFGIYSALLWQAPLNESVKSVASLFKAVEAVERRDTSSNVFETITNFADKYFHDPNSPVRNEDFYLPYVQGLAASDVVSPSIKPAYEYDASMCSLNKIGTKAADFSFTDMNGKVHTLYGVKADYTLLFFSNPGCPNCKEIIDMIQQSEGVSEMEKTGRLKVVNVYIDQEIDKWKAYASEYPKEWVCGYDHNYIIRTDLTYNVRAIPSLYLLDKDKKVILKDAPQDKVFEMLDSLAG